MTRLIATRQFPLGGQTVRPGDVFDCESRAARTLILTGRAQAVESERPALLQARPETISEMEIHQPDITGGMESSEYVHRFRDGSLPSTEASGKRKRSRPKGSYKRRDLRAEE